MDKTAQQVSYQVPVVVEHLLSARVVEHLLLVRVTHDILGLLLGTEAPVITPNGVDFSFLSFHDIVPKFARRMFRDKDTIVRLPLLLPACTQQ